MDPGKIIWCNFGCLLGGLLGCLHWRFVIDKAAEVTIDYVFVDKSDTCSKCNMQRTGLMGAVTAQRSMLKDLPPGPNCFVRFAL